MHILALKHSTTQKLHAQNGENEDKHDADQCRVSQWEKSIDEGVYEQTQPRGTGDGTERAKNTHKAEKAEKAER